MATPKKPIEEHKPDGRPTKYKASMDEEVFRLCLLGLKDAEIAFYFNVNESTLNDWKKKHPKFYKSIRAGRVEADGKVTRALYKAALGYNYTEVKIERLTDEERLSINEGGELIDDTIPAFKKTLTLKHVAPDTRAAQFWLKNRRPDLWRDKTEVAATVAVATYEVGFTEPIDITPIEDNKDESEQAALEE